MSASASINPPTDQPTTDNDEGSLLRQAAQSMDAGLEVQEEAIHPAPSKADKGGQPAGDAGAGNITKPSKTEGKPGTAAESKPDPAGADPKGDNKPGEQKPGESSYEKAKKEAERFDRNWQKFQQQQEAFRQQTADFERRERELAEREQRLQRGGADTRQPAGTGPLKDQDGYTADEYDKAAAAWERQGKFDLADGAKERAKALRDREARGERPAADNRQPGASTPAQRPEQTPGTPQFTAEWNRHLAEIQTDENYADLKKKDSPLYKEVAQLLHAEPRLSQFNDGIRIAAEIGKLRLEAAAVPGLRKQLEDQTTELEKLRKAVSPGAGGSESRGTPKKFEDMSLSEQEAHLRNTAAEADS